MKKLELAGAFTILGALVVSQVLGNHGDMAGHEADSEGLMDGAMAAMAPNMATANLAVTGMT
jgi:branched-subunit amino acid transport protein